MFESTGWVEAELSEPVAFVHYGLISANDAAERDPRDWPAGRAPALQRRHRAAAAVGSGPRGGYTAKSGVGFTGLKALQYAGTHEAEGRGYSYNKVFDVDVPVRSTTELTT